MTGVIKHTSVWSTSTWYTAYKEKIDRWRVSCEGVGGKVFSSLGLLMKIANNKALLKKVKAMLTNYYE